MTPQRKFAMAADSVLIAHAVFALFAVVGGFAVAVDGRVAFAHVPVVAWSCVVNLAHWTCPLTPLEKQLRVRAGQPAFEGGWIQAYIEPWLRPLGMPHRMQLVAGISIVVWNALLYAIILWWNRGA